LPADNPSVALRAPAPLHRGGSVCRRNNAPAANRGGVVVRFQSLWAKPGTHMDLLFYEFLDLVAHSLHLGSDDDLHGGLSGPGDAGDAGGLEGPLLHQEAILDLAAQAGDAVGHTGDIASAAATGQQSRGQSGIVAAAQVDVHL